MTEKDVIKIMRNHYEGKFPIVCPKCGLRLETILEYIQLTSRLGDAISYDAEIENWTPSKPFGIIAYSNCPCGTTIALGTADMPVLLHHQILRWVRSESLKRGVSPTQLLSHIRDQLRRQVLAESL